MPATFDLPICGTRSEYFTNQTEADAYASALRAHLGSRARAYRITIVEHDRDTWEVRCSNW